MKRPLLSIAASRRRSVRPGEAGAVTQNLSGRLAKRVSRLVRQFCGRKYSQGFSMIVVFLLVLVVLTSTLSLASRTTSGVLAEGMQGKLRLARDAAENGLVISVSELNKPANRMLVGAVPLNHWTTNNYEVVTDGNRVRVAAGNRIYPSDCMLFTNETPRDRIYQITQEALDMAPIDSPHVRVEDSDNHQYFKVLGIRLADKDRVAISRNSTVASNAVSYLTMTVEGIYSNSVAPTNGNSNPANSVHYTIQQEYQLVPRCCSSNSYPVDSGQTTDACTGFGSNYKPEWMARSVSQAAIFKATGGS